MFAAVARSWLWLIVGVFSNYVIGEQEAQPPTQAHHHLQQQIQQQLLATHALMVTPGFGLAYTNFFLFIPASTACGDALFINSRSRRVASRSCHHLHGTAVPICSYDNYRRESFQIACDYFYLKFIFKN